jgi:uncharacterized protein
MNDIAIVGASNNKEKYGYKISSFLKENGFTIIPINPKEKQILGLKVFENLTLAKKANEIELVVFIVPPKITKKILEEVNLLGLKKVWLQPGSENKESIDYCKKNNIQLIYEKCVMKEYQKNGIIQI